MWFLGLRKVGVVSILRNKKSGIVSFR